ncbi:MAG TPA: phosphatidylinositol mannoside acyltransferase [Acidimicrobiales bacterium]|nr:phosphatidylinositol mannoside acyltransferase [Acidimicrobiales bacterium]
MGAKSKSLTYKALATAMGRLPEPVSRGVAGGVSKVMSWRGGANLAMNERHMRRILASECVDGVEPDPRLVHRWSRRTYAEYARYWADGARLPFTGSDEVYAHMRMERGDDVLRAAMAKGRGVIMALPHVGSWEWGGAWLALEGMPMTAVVETLDPPELFEWFIKQRAEMGLTAVPMGDGSGAAILRALKAGLLVGLVSDRDLVGNGVDVEFFGEKTTLPSGPATLALRTGAALLPTVVYAGPGAWHTGVVLPPLDTTRSGSLRADVARLTQELATCFEGFILRHPEQWHLYQPNWPSDRMVDA